MIKCKKCKKEIVEYWEKTTKLCLDCVRERETDEFGSLVSIIISEIKANELYTRARNKNDLNAIISLMYPSLTIGEMRRISTILIMRDRLDFLEKPVKEKPIKAESPQEKKDPLISDGINPYIKPFGLIKSRIIRAYMGNGKWEEVEV